MRKCVLGLGLMVSFNAFADSSGCCNDDCTCTWEKTGTVLTISGNDNASMKDYGGTWNTGAPWENADITEINISGISRIGNYAFSGANKVESINVPDSVTSIGSWALSGMASLKTFAVPKNLKVLNDNTFNGCSSLESIDLGNVEQIGTSWSPVFSGTTSLKNIILPETLTSVAQYAFSGSGITELIVPAYAGGFHRFKGMENVEKITFEEGTTTIGWEDFQGNTSIKTVILPSTITSIQTRAFENCINLTNIELPEKLTAIGEAAFYGSGLTSLSVPDSVETIGKNAFKNATNLKSIIIGDNVTSIGADAFDGLSDDALIYCKNTAKHICRTLINETTKGANKVVEYTINTQGFLVANGKKYASLDDLKAGHYIKKRIYTVDEANAVTGPVNRVSISYR